ncbi:MAG TPA: hypothetical protein PKM58_05865 [Pyrinomonadaceae bacterium]|nr:hypothetical protein [Pyrinomonadaceae bacterium]
MMRNSRTVYGLIAFAVAFVFSAGLVRILFPAPYDPAALAVAPVQVRESYCDRRRHPKKPKLAMRLEEFIEQDKANGDDRSTDLIDGNMVSATYTDSVREYYDTSSSMNTDAFPREFVAAWNEHMRAWKNYADYLDLNRERRVDTEVFSSKQRKYNEEISRTWGIVIRLARENGAEVTPY